MDYSKSKIARLIVCAAMALTLTAVTYRADHHARSKRTTATWLALSRHLSDQAQAFTLVAKEHAEEQPVRWVVDRMSQTTDGHAFAALRITDFQKAVGSPNEYFNLDKTESLFEYEKILTPENGSGIRLEWDLTQEGFLGMTSRLWQDLALGLVFAAYAVLVWGISQAVSSKNKLPPPVVTKDPALGEFTHSMLDSAKKLLSDAGVAIKDVIRNAKEITVAAATSHKTIESLRLKVHGRLNELSDCRVELAKALKAATQAEVDGLNVIIESNRIGEKGTSLGKLCEKIHQSAQSMRLTVEAVEQKIQNAEKEIEPLAMDLDQATQEFAEIFKTASNMDTPIKKASESMVAQAKWIQSARAPMPIWNVKNDA